MMRVLTSEWVVPNFFRIQIGPSPSVIALPRYHCSSSDTVTEFRFGGTASGSVSSTESDIGSAPHSDMEYDPRVPFCCSPQFFRIRTCVTSSHGKGSELTLIYTLHHPAMSRRLSSVQDYTSLLSRYDTWMFDCDGVLWRGNRLIDGAVQVLDMLRRASECVRRYTQSQERFLHGF